ncbi:hypothetical protein A4X13_0g4698 [Tilletia indica]|uniref:DASH complex subunit DUO1 n=1 Tax=Tilletia indica TaxID=43049 RepID=A0A177TQJ8_9BASI|nr:hypothetical protein A4X13_0g4698 [Tilletia indica]
MSSSRPQTPQTPRTRAARPVTSPNLLDNLLTTADADTDAATAPNLADLSLTELVAPNQSSKSAKQQGGRPSLKGKGRASRPSWGPTPAGTTSGQIRLLQGLPDLGEDDSNATGASVLSSFSKASGKLPPSAASGPGARGAAGRPRFSLFTRKSLAPTQLQRAGAGTEAQDLDEPQTGAASLPRLSEADPLADESRLVDDRLPEPEQAPPPAQPQHEDPASSSVEPSNDPSSDVAGNDSSTLRAIASREREEALKRNLLEVRRMNEVFEGYESMLMGSAEQIDQFDSRVKTTDHLLDCYIALLRDSSRTQELLLSTEWKGASADSAEAHDLAVALAERETERVRELEERRRREAEIERRRREAEGRERERAREEEAKRAALIASAGYGGVRGGTRTTGTGAARGGAGAGVRRGASTAGAGTGRGGARPPVAGHTRGASASTRGASSTSSSSSSRLGRPSSIPRPPSAGGY